MNTALVKRRDSRDVTGREPTVPAKAKEAIRVLLDQPKTDLHAAAQAAGLTTYLLRKYLKMPHVRAYLRAERIVLLDAVALGNPLALKRIRDESGNDMASVQAAKSIEAMRNEDQQGAPGRFAPQTPGVTIVIESADGRTAEVIGPQRRVIEHEADEFGPVDAD